MWRCRPTVRMTGVSSVRRVRPVGAAAEATVAGHPQFVPGAQLHLATQCPARASAASFSARPSATSAWSAPSTIRREPRARAAAGTQLVGAERARRAAGVDRDRAVGTEHGAVADQARHPSRLRPRRARAARARCATPGPARCRPAPVTTQRAARLRPWQRRCCAGWRCRRWSPGPGPPAGTRCRPGRGRRQSRRCWQPARSPCGPPARCACHRGARCPRRSG